MKKLAVLLVCGLILLSGCVDNDGNISPAIVNENGNLSSGQDIAMGTANISRLVVGTGRSGIVIAASDSPQIWKDQADYVVSASANFSNQMAAALLSMPSGGAIVLSPGTFEHTAEIDISVPIKLSGSGYSTVVLSTANMSNSMSFLSGAVHSDVSDMVIDGNGYGANFTVGSQYMSLHNVVLQGHTNLNLRVMAQNFYFYGSQVNGSGIEWNEAFGEIYNNDLNFGGHNVGILLNSTSQQLVSGNWFGGYEGAAIRFSNNSHYGSSITNNHFGGNGIGGTVTPYTIDCTGASSGLVSSVISGNTELPSSSNISYSVGIFSGYDLVIEGNLWQKPIWLGTAVTGIRAEGSAQSLIEYNGVGGLRSLRIEYPGSGTLNLRGSENITGNVVVSGNLSATNLNVTGKSALVGKSFVASYVFANGAGTGNVTYGGFPFRPSSLVVSMFVGGNNLYPPGVFFVDDRGVVRGFYNVSNEYNESGSFISGNAVDNVEANMLTYTSDGFIWYWNNGNTTGYDVHIEVLGYP